MSSPFLPIASELFDTQNPKRFLLIGISPGQEVLLKQVLDFPGALIDFARNAHHAQMFIEELGDTTSYDLLWFDEDFMHNGDWEFLKRLQQNAYNPFLPIILQTRPDTDVFTKAIEHNIFYFLTKPYAKEQILSVLASALHGLSNYNEINRFVSDYRTSIQLFRHAIFHARLPNEIKSLAATLAYLTPNQEKTSFGLYELMNNAIEHGSLGFDYQSKGELLCKGQFNSELEERLKSIENSHKYVEITVTFVENFIEFSIRDFGPGFNYENYIQNLKLNQPLPNGRGILIAKTLSFDSLHYEEGGKVAIARVKIKDNN